MTTPHLPGATCPQISTVQLCLRTVRREMGEALNLASCEALDRADAELDSLREANAALRVAAEGAGERAAPESSAAYLLAESVLHMELVTARGLHAADLARQVLKIAPYAEDSPAESVLRELASYLGAGGYNAPAVDAEVFKDKIMWGIDQLTKRPHPL